MAKSNIAHLFPSVDTASRPVGVVQACTRNEVWFQVHLADTTAKHVQEGLQILFQFIETCNKSI